MQIINNNKQIHVWSLYSRLKLFKTGVQKYKAEFSIEKKIGKIL